MAMILLFSIIALKRFYYEHCLIRILLQLTFVYLQVAFLSFWLGLIERSMVIQYRRFMVAIIGRLSLIMATAC